ncbi:MAG: response regulator, partial [Rhodothermales bacterium]|nr:response regulator [Rhodothermales bacterium]
AYHALVLAVTWFATSSAQFWWQHTTGRWNELKNDYHLTSVRLANEARQEISAMLGDAKTTIGASGYTPDGLHHHLPWSKQDSIAIRRHVEKHLYTLGRAIAELKNVSDQFAPQKPLFLIETILTILRDLQSVAADTTMDPSRSPVAMYSKIRELDFRATQLQRFHLAAYSTANEAWRHERTVGSYALYAFLVLTFGIASVFVYVILGRIVRADRELKESQARLAEAQRIAKLGTWDWFPADNRVVVSEEAARQFDLASGVRETDLDELLAKAQDADGQSIREKIRVTATFGTSCEFDFRMVCGDGSERYVRLYGEAEYGADSTQGMVRFAQIDVTDLIETQAQLRESQKMEAVGHLTGGIAHDFNNLLAVSLGNVELGQEVARQGGDVQPYLATIKRANERGATLTNQLLAFSRKQTLNPEVVDAGELVTGMASLLRRALGETIEVEVAADDNLWPCNVDPHQLESGILNLAVNSRDAMPGGGKLSIRILNVALDDDYAAAQAEVEPGDYVLVSVADTGTGIPKNVIEQVFEPFFTTKDPGRGTGLGLSMVYGFVKQSSGHVTVYSEEGKGTTFKLYLPRSDEPVRHSEKSDHQVQPSSHGETVLVVEDDPDVRTLSVALLRSLGYEIVEAADGESAIKALDSAPNVNLLFTDVVLPGGMSGPELAEKIRQRWPGIPVLFTSGYTELVDFDQSLLNQDSELLRKPFRKADLATKVRVALDRAAEVVDFSDHRRAVW